MLKKSQYITGNLSLGKILNNKREVRKVEIEDRNKIEQTKNSKMMHLNPAILIIIINKKSRRSPELMRKQGTTTKMHFKY